jgi:four helix bundle protein
MRYEDLAVWKRSTRLSIEIYQHLRELKDFGFKDQITRSGLSVPSNIAEGFDRESNKECVTFLSYAKGSCAELRTQIYIGIEIGYIERMTGERWIQETQEISLMLGGLIKTKRSFIKPRFEEQNNRSEERGK